MRQKLITLNTYFYLMVIFLFKQKKIVAVTNSLFAYDQSAVVDSTTSRVYDLG